ncbi:hypothetical protein A4X13_0g8266 [Tilletia indica]|uniref:Uncharacterized protein n=1 Tax=Tilletia indica TaxID=43049 RepID=A0A177TBC1_9BASI|nr:hypothetical protein A4X13_0g8266 [Tilletia indica]
MLVWIRLDTRPVRVARTEKLDPFRLGPLSIRRVLSPHHVLADVPPELNIESELGVAKLDVHPAGADPFASERDAPDSAEYSDANPWSERPFPDSAPALITAKCYLALDDCQFFSRVSPRPL